MRIARIRTPSGEVSYAEERREGFLPLVGLPWHRLEHAPGPLLPEAIRLVPAEPSKILCIGRNYREHAKELGSEVPAVPLFFLKPPSSLVAAGEPIVRPVHLSALVHHEGELAVVLGRALKNATRTEAESAIFGYTCANDVTARDLQREDKHFSRAKGFDTFCPLGPAIVTASAIPDAQALGIKVSVSGELRQNGTTRDMVFPVSYLLAYLSRVMRLEAGDVILTGTPAGVGPLEAGHEVSVSIEGIGTLTNPVVDGSRLTDLD